MSSQTIAVLKANMPLDTGGGVSAADMHDVLDTLEDRTTQQILTQTDSYTASIADNRRKVCFTGTSPSTLFLSTNIPIGWECIVCQRGTGLVTITAMGSGAVLSRSAHRTTAGQNTVAYLLCLANPGASPQILLAGDTAVAEPVVDEFSSEFSSEFA